MFYLRVFLISINVIATKMPSSLGVVFPVQLGVPEGTLFLLGNSDLIRYPRPVPGSVVPLDHEEHGDDAVHGCDHRVSGLDSLKPRYGGDVFILSLVVSLLLPYSRKWMWVYIIVSLVFGCET